MKVFLIMNKALSKKLNEVGLTIPHILFPRKGIDLNKFSCIAADQFTQNLDYWRRVKKYVGDSPSTYNLIYPEAEYLEDYRLNESSVKATFLTKKIDSINSTMKKYIEDGIYEDIGPSFVLVERKRCDRIRQGLIVAIDLEKYDYNEGVKTLMRATEKTVKDRLVVRRDIRRNATLDMPHILVLINDKENKLFGKLNNMKSAIQQSNKLLYDFDLMENGGHLTGFQISNECDIESIIDTLIELKNVAKDGLLYAVGDGNHSLAAAKDIYEETGRGRYALVELVNIYDKGLNFYPIHRLIMGLDKNQFIKETGIDPLNPPPLQDLQKILDEHEYKIDYIHGKKECEELGKLPHNIAITYDEFSVDTLFSDVIKHGSLCRKSFSMGEAEDKRYYLEAQLIK